MGASPPPVMMSMPASSWSFTAARVARYWASAMSALVRRPASTSFSRASHQRGTLYESTTVVV